MPSKAYFVVLNLSSFVELHISCFIYLFSVFLIVFLILSFLLYLFISYFDWSFGLYWSLSFKFYMKGIVPMRLRISVLFPHQGVLFLYSLSNHFSNSQKLNVVSWIRTKHKYHISNAVWYPKPDLIETCLTSRIDSSIGIL
jgi:hypothetical protein